MDDRIYVVLSNNAESHWVFTYTKFGGPILLKSKDDLEQYCTRLKLQNLQPLIAMLLEAKSVMHTLAALSQINAQIVMGEAKKYDDFNLLEGYPYLSHELNFLKNQMCFYYPVADVQKKNTIQFIDPVSFFGQPFPDITRLQQMNLPYLLGFLQRYWSGVQYASKSWVNVTWLFDLARFKSDPTFKKGREDGMQMKQKQVGLKLF